MIRQQKRKEIRDITKSLQKAKNTKEYKSMRYYFETLSRADFELLEANTHTDPKAVADYKRHRDNMAYLIKLEARLEMLVSGVHEQNTGLVKQD